MTDEYLWSVRNVAEFAYCPRLFYLMEVEGLHLSNTDTELGNRIHKRVDKHSAVKKSEKTESCKPKTVRSLTLTDYDLKLTATLDIADIKGKQAFPIEYRKGSAKRNYILPNISQEETETPNDLYENEPWPTDKIQIALQAILLEKNGYDVNQGYIFYAKEKLKLAVKIDEELEKYALEILKQAQNCAKGSRPKPLENDPRCPRCSLQPVCLPDEVISQQKENTAKVYPRKIWPPRDDGIIIVVQENGTKVGVSSKCLVIKSRYGKKISEAPLTSVECISLVGSVQISTQAIHTISSLNIPISFLSYSGRLVSIIEPNDSVSAKIRKNQVKQFDNKKNCLQMAKELIHSKIINQRTLIMRNNDNIKKFCNRSQYLTD